jgi:hypothetical protein
MRAGRLAALMAVVALGAGCFGAGKRARVRKALTVPERSTTAGDDLLGVIPAGLDLLIEIDLRRLRTNPVVGDVARTLLSRKSSAERLEVASLEGVDLVAICSYAIGTERAASLTIVRGPGVRHWKNVHRIDDHTVALGPNRLLDRLRKVAGKKQMALAKDREFLRKRAAAMPDRAPAATLRITARLGFDARVRLAGMFDLEQVPTSLSVWGDVIDDLAVVGLLGGTSERQARALGDVAERWRARLMRDPVVRRLLLRSAVRFIRVQTKGKAVRLVWVIGPRRLERLVKRFTPSSESSKSESQP